MFEETKNVFHTVLPPLLLSGGRQNTARAAVISRREEEVEDKDAFQFLVRFIQGFWSTRGDGMKRKTRLDRESVVKKTITIKAQALDTATRQGECPRSA